MPPQPLQYSRLTENNLKEHTKSFVDSIALQEQFILDYVLEQQIINNEKSQELEKEHSLSSDSEKSKITLSGHSRYSIEHDLPSTNGSLLISRNQLRKSRLSEIKESDSQDSKKIFPKKERIESTRRGKPLKDKCLNIDHSNQRNRKSSKKEKNKCLQNKRNISKTDRRKSCKKVDSVLASSQIMQNWSSDKLGTNRVTLRSDNKAGLGIFNKGKASEKIKTKGVPDLVFSEIDFLNSNMSCKRKNQNEDDSGQKNGSFSRIRRKSGLPTKLRKCEQDTTRNSLQDTDEISSSYDSVCNKDYRTLAKKKKQEKIHSTKNLSIKRQKTSNNKHYNKLNKSKHPQTIRVESKVASISESSHELLDEKSISSNNCSNASYSLVNKKTYSPEHNRVDKMSELQDEQNIMSPQFIDEQKNESSKYASSHNEIRSRSRKNKQVISPYFASNKIKYKQTEQTELEDNHFLNQNIESSPKSCSPVVDTNKQGTHQKDSQVEETALKNRHEESLSVQEKMTNDNMKLDNDSKQLPIDESTKNFPNNRAISSEENDNNLCSERMDIHFDPTWIKRKSLLSSQLQDQKMPTSDNKIKTYQSHRLSHAVIAEGAKVGQSCRPAKEDCGSINNINTEFEINEIVNDDEKARQEIFVEDTDLEHMNVNLFGNAIQSNCQEVISNVDNRFNMCHEDPNQIIFNDLNDTLYKSHYESNNELTYGSIGGEFFAQEFAVDDQNFQDSNLYLTLEKNLPYEENQHWIQPHIEQNFKPQTSTLISPTQNQFLWSTNNKSSNLINKELIQAAEVQNNQSWEDYNSQYITAEHDDDPIENYDDECETDSGIARFVWKKHRLH